MKISRDRRNQPEPDAGQAQPEVDARLRADDAPDRQVMRPGQEMPAGEPDQTRARRDAETGELRQTPGDPQAGQHGYTEPQRHGGTPPQHEGMPAAPGRGGSPGGAQVAPGPGGERADNPVAQSNPHSGTGHPGGNGGERVLAEADLGRLRDEWREVQTMFVDDPRDAVTRANGLVEGTIQQLTETYAQRRQALENRWARAEHDDTEELRQALRGYRQLFDQLLDTAGAATNM